MKTRSPRLSAVSCLFLMSNVSLAQVVELMQITHDDEIQNWPAIHCDNLVWVDFKDDGTSGAIFYYNLKTKETKRLTSYSRSKQETAVFDNNVVWISRGLSFIDIAVGVERQLVDRQFQWNPSIHKNKVVFTSQIEIHLYDLQTDTETKLTEPETASQRSPKIFEDSVVYADGRDGEIHLMDLKTGESAAVSWGIGFKNSPVIFKHHIAWHAQLAGVPLRSHVYYYNSNTRESRQLTQDQSEQGGPWIYENLITFIDNRSGEWEIVIYDLDTDEEIPLILPGGRKQHVSIHGNRVVYRASDDIYVAVLDQELVKIYVNGNDPSAGDGSRQNPFNTIGGALSSMECCATVLIQAGEYNEKLSIEKKAILKADNGKVVIGR